MSYLFITFMPFLFLPILISQYTIIQSQHYELKKYFYYQPIKKILLQILLLSLLLLSFSFKQVSLYLTLISTILTNTILINKNNLKYTKRTKRFLLIYFLLTYALFLFLPFNIITTFNTINSAFIIYLIIIHILSSCLEKGILYYYLKDAKCKIKNKIVIGITGSYGKTSSKNILYDLLKDKVNVSKTPKSYNTKVGIIKSIREEVSLFDDYFICEYGVDKKGGMDKLLRVVTPHISLITEIGNQHLLTFKNIENIYKEKIKLAKVLNSDQVVVLNNDNKYLSKAYRELKCKIITYGIISNSDIMAKNIEITNKGSLFDLYVDNKYLKRLSTSLLGEHNILNILGAIGVLKGLNINLSDIDKLVKEIRPVEHRLQIKKINNIKVIDDSFNSNEIGFKKAIDILNLMKEEKIVITPGIIEQGNNSENLNYELGRYMASKVDLIILVEKNAHYIKEGLIKEGFDEKKIIEKKYFIEAWEYIKKIYDDNKIILIENDLPSIYLK